MEYSLNNQAINQFIQQCKYKSPYNVFYKKILEHISQANTDELYYQNYIERCYSSYCIYGQFIQSIVGINEQPILFYGIPILEKSDIESIFQTSSNIANNKLYKAKSINFDEVIFDVYVFAQKIQEQSICIVFVTPPSISVEAELLQLIFSICTLYFKNIANQNQQSVFELYSGFLDKLIQRVNYSLSTNGIGTMVHFYFQNMDIYFKNTSEKFTENTLNEIDSIIKKVLTDPDDFFYRISKNSILMFFSNSKIDKVRVKLKELNISVHQIILNYRVTYIQIQKPLKSDEFLSFIQSGF